jgi:hypothetical protein
MAMQLPAPTQTGRSMLNAKSHVTKPRLGRGRRSRRLGPRRRARCVHRAQVSWLVHSRLVDTERRRDFTVGLALSEKTQ